MERKRNRSDPKGEGEKRKEEREKERERERGWHAGANHVEKIYNYNYKDAKDNPLKSGLAEAT